MPDIVLRSVPSDANSADVRLYSTTVATGALAATEVQDAASFVGALGHTGTIAATEAQDTAAFTGIHGQTGTLAATETQDTANFAGTVGSSSVSGTLAATETQDTADFSGTATGDLIGRKYPRRGRSRPRTVEEETQEIQAEIKDESLEVRVNTELLEQYKRNLEQIEQQGLALAKSGETAKRIAAQIADLEASIKASELKLSRLRQEEEFLLMVVISL